MCHLWDAFQLLVLTSHDKQSYLRQGLTAAKANMVHSFSFKKENESIANYHVLALITWPTQQWGETRS